MRDRERILQSLERIYREAFETAEGRGESTEMARLELEYQRDQIALEVLIDIRELLAPSTEERTRSLIDKAQKLRGLAKRR